MDRILHSTSSSFGNILTVSINTNTSLNKNHFFHKYVLLKNISCRYFPGNSFIGLFIPHLLTHYPRIYTLKLTTSLLIITVSLFFSNLNGGVNAGFNLVGVRKRSLI